MRKDRIALLLGAGASFPSGGSSGTDVTERLLETAWMLHTDQAFYPRPLDEGRGSDEIAGRAQAFIRILDTKIRDRIISHSSRFPNYEDYFSCLKQIVQDETGEIVNPLIEDSLKSFRDASAFLHAGKEYHIDRNSFASLAERAMDLIQYVVSHSLRSLEKPVGYELMAEIIEKIEEVDIFSLNHDLLTERKLEEQEILFADGFGEKDGNVTYFNHSWDTFKGPVHLLKLHGSIDWYLVRPKNGADKYAKLKGGIYEAKDGMGQRLDPLSAIPSFLTGTTIKEQAYGTNLFGELFYHFHGRLRRTTTLICSGYSWSDKGINNRIREWLLSDNFNRVIILHGREGESLEQKQFWYWYWEKFTAEKRVIQIPKWFSDCSFQELQVSLEAMGARLLPSC